jgi:hypothetical protein
VAARDWSKIRSRKLMRDRGVDNVRDDAPFMMPLVSRKHKRRPPSKADLRAQAAAALASFTGTVTRLPARNKPTRK